MPANGDDIVCRFRGDRLSFAHESVSLHIPPVYADRCKLLCNLKNQVEADVDVPLALSVREVQAWKACVRATATTSRGPPSPLQAVQDSTLLPALVVWFVFAELCRCASRNSASVLQRALSPVPSLTITSKTPFPGSCRLDTCFCVSARR